MSSHFLDFNFCWQEPALVEAKMSDESSSLIIAGNKHIINIHKKRKTTFLYKSAFVAVTVQWNWQIVKYRLRGRHRRNFWRMNAQLCIMGLGVHEWTSKDCKMHMIMGHVAHEGTSEDFRCIWLWISMVMAFAVATSPNWSQNLEQNEFTPTYAIFAQTYLQYASKIQSS